MLTPAPQTASISRRDRLARARRAVLADVLAHVEARRPLLVLKAPPGSGKTHVLLRAVALAWHLGQRVAVATQTNTQADDLCVRLAREFPKVVAHRFAAHGHEPDDLGASVAVIHAARDLPDGACVVVATSSKWASTDDPPEFDLLLVDEAWQMAWAEFMLLAPVASRFVLVGDPGQIEPTVTIPVERWETSARPPHRAAPAVLLSDPSLPCVVRALPVSTRLPHDTVALVKGFYDFDFDAWSEPGERRVEAAAPRTQLKGVDDAIDLLSQASVSLLTLPTPQDGAADDDRELAEVAASVVRRLLDRGAVAAMDGVRAPLGSVDLGVVSTHRAMNGRLAEALGDLAWAVRVDTPERWQGLERKVMVAVHPLSGVTRPSAFDLATGRLCVMASRHQVGLVLVSRDHVGDTLEGHAPVADQAPGVPDDAGRGHAQNLALWRWLHEHGRVAAG